jgi:hypothetical protein
VNTTRGCAFDRLFFGASTLIPTAIAVTAAAVLTLVLRLPLCWGFVLMLFLLVGVFASIIWWEGRKG